MNSFENGVIKHQINLEAYKNGKANEIISVLDKASYEIAKYVKQTKDVAVKARYREIERKLNDISKSLKKTIGKKLDLDGIIQKELNNQKRLLKGLEKELVTVKGGKVNFLYPTVEQIKTGALFKPVTEGFTYDSYLEGIERGFYNVWDSAVRTGYITGQPTSVIVENVMGGLTPKARLKNQGQIQALRNNIYSNTRTVLQSFASETRNRVFEENEDYFGDGESSYKYEWLSVLDARTCLVCGELDGKLFESIEDAPSIPVHRGCRCILVPYFNIKGDTRASKNGYVKDKITFDGWLRKQDEKTQKEVLGITRYNMFKDGKKISQFVDNGRVIPLDRLDFE